tara:strand:- start:198 stop:413 length:216 start_codon:yes stop_codon:yes gene_type:complete
MNAVVLGMERSFLGLTPKYWGILVVVMAGLFLIGLDQGQTLSTIMGQTAYQQNLLHELFHDVRHAAGFICH